MDVPATKVCTRCKVEYLLNLGNFHRNAPNKDGYKYECKTCANLRVRLLWQKNRAKYHASMKRYQLAHREELRQKAKIARQEHNEEINRKRRARWAKNRDAIAVRRREQYRLNPEPIRKAIREAFQRLPKKVKQARTRSAYINNKPSYFRNNEIRRARLAHAPVIERINRKAIYERDAGICHICKHKVSKRSFSLDHLIPLSKGGSHTAINLALSHKRCNSQRGAGRLPAQLRLIG